MAGFSTALSLPLPTTKRPSMNCSSLHGIGCSSSVLLAAFKGWLQELPDLTAATRRRRDRTRRLCDLTFNRPVGSVDS